MNESLYYKSSQKLSYGMFKELLACEENDRSKKQLKKDYRALEQNHRQVKFKHLIGKRKLWLKYEDYYLNSSEGFGKSLKAVDA
jgi:hypothetical protein